MANTQGGRPGRPAVMDSATNTASAAPASGSRRASGAKVGQKMVPQYSWVADRVSELAEELTDNKLIIQGAAILAFAELSDDDKLNYAAAARKEQAQNVRGLRGQSELQGQDIESEIPV